MSCEGKELSDFRDTPDVLGASFGSEAKVLVESLSDDISVKDEDLLVVGNERVNFDLECGRKGRLSSA